MSPLEELATLLRPAGGGLYLVSTGRAEQLALQQRLYGVATVAQVQQRFEAQLERIVSARGVLLGVPSDVGAGFCRGANLGPQAIRLQMLDDGFDVSNFGVVDVGDVFVVPQLLEDDMLSQAQLEATRRALYAQVPQEIRAQLPVSPLSIARRAWELILTLNPRVKPLVLGGDHSTALPGVQALHRVAPQPWGIVQPDAHTDLLEERLGIRHCFATWSWHANELLGRQGRLTQVGTRASGKTQEHWETTLGVRQFWAREVLDNPAAQLEAIIHHLQSLRLRGVYFSNDIDGTDARWADATGTPEPQGLEPDWVVELIRRLGRDVGLLGGDVMEVAPSVNVKADSLGQTVPLAARYMRELIAAALP